MIDSSSVIFRKATEKDVSFIIDGLIASEKSGSEIFSFQTIFGLSENRFREIMNEVLPEDVHGQEWCYSDYVIAEVGGVRAGSLCAWIEGSGAKSSSILKGTLMQYFFPAESIEEAQKHRELIDRISFSKKPGSLIIESIYVVPEFRSQGLFKMLLEHCLAEFHVSNPEIKKCSLNVLKSNKSGIRAYENAGFKVIDEKFCDDTGILNLLPAQSRVLMEKIII